jgi:predicted nucleic acid-binding protein
MSYLVDTDQVASFLNGRSEAVQLLTEIRSSGLFISIITYGEIYDGIYGSRDPQNREAAFERVLRRVEVLPLTRTIMKRFARVRGELRRTGQGLPDADLLIASTALVHGLTLVTRNLRHFERIPDVHIHREGVL